MATGALRLVEGDVRVANQVLAVLFPGGLADRHTNARVLDDGLAVNDERRREEVEQARAHGGETVVVGDAGQVDELVAAEARDGVGVACHGAQALGDADEESVTRLVAEGVVHVLEVVEVDQEEGDASAVAACAGRGLRQPVAQERPVGEAGQ